MVHYSNLRDKTQVSGNRRAGWEGGVTAKAQKEPLAGLPRLSEHLGSQCQSVSNAPLPEQLWTADERWGQSVCFQSGALVGPAHRTE